jgi:hypothetical protein
MLKLQPQPEYEVVSYQRSITSKYEYARDFWAACDGLKLEIQTAVDDTTQNML